MSRSPLENDLILQIIAKHLDDEDLRTCRILNRRWRNAVDKDFLQRCGMLHVKSLDPVQVGGPSGKQQATIARLLECSHNVDDPDPLAFLLRRYQNVTIHDSKNNPILQGSWNNFFHAYGEQLRKLTITSKNLLHSVENFVAISSCKFTPSLEELCVQLGKKIILPVPEISGLSEKLSITAKVNKHLRKLELQTDGTNSITAIMEHMPWMNVLCLYPNVKILVMEGWPHAVFKDVATTIASIRKVDSKKWNLTNLSVHGNRSQDSSWRKSDTGIAHGRQVVQLLVEANLQLQFIDIDQAAGFCCMELANNQHETIKVLKMISEISNETFKMMPNLEQLVTLDTSNFTFLETCPNLVSLEISKPLDVNYPLTWPANTLIRPITSLTTISSISFFWRSSDLQRLFHYMPNITALKMFINDAGLLCVYEHLRKLRKLSVAGLFGELTDNGIVGREEVEKTNVESINITNLKDLEVFNMSATFTYSGLTARSITGGFLKLDKLVEASLILKTGVDPEVVKSLYNKVPKLDITYM